MLVCGGNGGERGKGSVIFMGESDTCQAFEPRSLSLFSERVEKCESDKDKWRRKEEEEVEGGKGNKWNQKKGDTATM